MRSGACCSWWRTAVALTATSALILSAGGLVLVAPAPVAAAQTATTSAIPDPAPALAAVEILSVTPQAPDLGGDDTVTVTVRVTNKQALPLRNLDLRLQRGEQITAASQLRTRLTEPESTYSFVTPFQRFDEVLRPEESLEATLQVQLSELQISSAGVYPLVVNLNGQIDQAPPARLHDARVLLPVTGELSSTGTTTTQSQSPSAAQSTPGLTMLLPLASSINFLPGGVGDAPNPARLVVRDDDLAESLSAGGRLRELLDSYTAALTDPDMQASSCLAIDPAVVRTAEAMTHGYTVADRRPSVRPTRLRDADRTQITSREGEGSEAAAVWLADLQSLVADNCVVAYPESGTDVDALIPGSGDYAQALALFEGRVELAELLGVTPLEGVVPISDGQLRDTGAATLGWSAMPLDFSTDEAFDQQAFPTPDAAGVTAIVGDSSIAVATGSSAVESVVTLSETGSRGLVSSDAVTASLAAVGESPQALAVQPAAWDFALAADAAGARTQNAVAALYFAALSSGREQLVITPPPTWSASGEEATAILSAVAALLEDGYAEAVPLPVAAGLPTTAEATLQGAPPLVDTTAMSFVNADIDRLTAVLVNDPNIALTRTRFTLPLRRDLLREASTYIDNQDPARLVDTQQAVAELVSSVGLINPGSNYTLASKESRVTLVAQNFLPLPAVVDVEVHESGTATVLPQGPYVIPALGSMPLQLPVTLVDYDRQDVGLQLVTQRGDALGAEVTVSVQAMRSVVAWVVGVVGMVVLAAVLLRPQLKSVLAKVQSRRPRRAAPARPAQPGRRSAAAQRDTATRRSERGERADGTARSEQARRAERSAVPYSRSERPRDAAPSQRRSASRSGRNEPPQARS